jgi:L-aminopeptidase/D-esterase-like protein
MFGGTPPSHNTTLGVVITNAALTKLDLEGLAGAAADALARCITPFATAFDGDIVFAASTAAVPPASPLQAEALAALAVPEAVRRAVRSARGVPTLGGGLPGLADTPPRL